MRRRKPGWSACAGREDEQEVEDEGGYCEGQEDEGGETTTPTRGEESGEGGRGGVIGEGWGGVEFGGGGH